MSNTRRLSYPLTLSARLGADNAEGDVKHIVPDFPADPDQRVFVKLELSLNEYIQLATAVDVGRDIAYGDYSENIWWLWIRSLFAIELTADGERSPLSQALTMGTCVVYIGSDESEECEMANCAKPVKIGGNWFLQMDCGCDNAQFFQLTPVSIDANGDPVGTADGGQFGSGFGGNAGGWYQNGVSELNCYQAAAVPYMIDRLDEFAAWLIDAGVLGVDWLLGQVDEWVDAIKLATGLIEGIPDLQDIQALVKSATSAAIQDPAVELVVAATWDFTGVPSRAELKQWAQTFPYTFNNIPLRQIAIQWAENSLMLGYRDALATFAASCESGNEIPSGGGFPGFAYTKGRFYDFTEGAQGWFGTSDGAAAEWDSGNGWWSVVTLQHEARIRHDIDAGTIIDHIIVAVEGEAGTEIRVYDTTLQQSFDTDGDAQVTCELSPAFQTTDGQIMIGYAYASDTGNLLKHIQGVYIFYTGTDMTDGVAI